MRRAVCQGDRRVAQGRFDGSIQGFPGVQSGENGEFLAIEAAEIDVFVQAMHCQKNGAGRELGHGANALSFVALVERVAGDVQIVRILANHQQQFIHRIAQREQADVGLQAQAQLRGIHARQIFGLERRFPQTVERFDIGPLQAGHVQRQTLPLSSPGRMLLQPAHQPRTKIAQRERSRRAIHQIRLGHRIEAAASQHGAHTRKIFGESGKHAEPILAIINFQAFERSQPVVGLDDLRRDGAHRAAIGRHRTHAFGVGQWSHDGTSHVALQVEKFHTASASETLARKRLAFSASSCTSSKEGMLSSHSSSVAVWPTRSMARAYNFHTGSITG